MRFPGICSVGFEIPESIIVNRHSKLRSLAFGSGGQRSICPLGLNAPAVAAQVLADWVSLGRSDWAARAAAVLDAVHQAVDPRVELTCYCAPRCAGCGSD